jgi:hypothetical protein
MAKAGLTDLFESIISVFTTLGAKGAEAGGKGAGLAIARKIGWASKDSGGGGGGIHGHRLGGHSLSGHSMANGYKGGGLDTLGGYDPKGSYSASLKSQYQNSLKSGSGVNRQQEALVQRAKILKELKDRSRLSGNQNKDNSNVQDPARFSPAAQGKYRLPGNDKKAQRVTKFRQSLNTGGWSLKRG